ncbi:Uncharacterised protein [uncultured archaeon]|nr:Uncharacterised protein [uncultured archaeon]
MKKMQIEILTAVGSVVLLFILIALSRLTLQSPGFGYMVALLLYALIMSFAGLKLAEIPDKS